MSKDRRTEKRKVDHIRICSTEKTQAHLTSAGFENIFFVHNAIPEIGLSDIDTSILFFDCKLSSPIIMAAMTGGTKEAIKINSNLAEAAEKLGLAMGVGSQRAAIEDPSQIYSFKIVREKAPTAFLMANIGCAQLADEYGVNEVMKAIEMIDANALAIHFNPLHEAVQVEGQTDFSRALKKIKEISQSIEIPIIAKETGGGISAEVAKKLEESGVKGIDVGGAGGTSWAAVEYYRARDAEKEHKRLGLTFWDWGIPTAISVVETVNSTSLATIATGGVRTGVDVAKALALGATAAGIASPLLKPAISSARRVEEELNILIRELKLAMYLTGVRSISELQKVPLVITGHVADWLRIRGFNPEAYIRK